MILPRGYVFEFPFYLEEEEEEEDDDDDDEGRYISLRL